MSEADRNRAGAELIERLTAAGFLPTVKGEQWFGPNGGVFSTEQALELLEAKEAEETA